MTDSVGQYLNEIGLVPLLTANEERELSQLVEAGTKARAAIEAGENTAENRRLARKGAEAKDRFIRANLRLVVSIARRYPLPPAMELLDLVQEGNLGLEHAVDKFRSEEHTSELQSLMRISYAVFCLKKKKQKKRTTPY